jgi:hypothetical protein
VGGRGPLKFSFRLAIEKGGLISSAGRPSRFARRQWLFRAAFPRVSGYGVQGDRLWASHYNEI